MRTVDLMSDDVVIITQGNEPHSSYAKSQFTLTASLSGLIAFKDILEEVIEEIKVQHKQNKKD